MYSQLYFTSQTNKKKKQKKHDSMSRVLDAI
jgi:hypothetical protein